MSTTPLQAQRIQSEWARLLLGSFADAGVCDVVVSPGSRSTPLVMAAIHHPRLRLWDLIDERAAAYFALGQARASGRPSLLLCTSGTAAANYLPAVVEAGAARVPLLVLSADRPLELQECGANQTIDQLKLYGNHARSFVDLGQADATPRALRALRRRVAQAVFTASWPEPGAVHLNARLRKPLEPPAVETPIGRGQHDEVDRLLSQPIVRASAPRQLPDPQALEGLVDDLRSAERGLMVCGPAPLEQVRQRRAILTLAARLGIPIAADAASQLRFRGIGDSRDAGDDLAEKATVLDGFDSLLHVDAFRHGLRPDCIVQIGRGPTSSRWESFLDDLVRDEHLSCPHWVISPQGWNDPANTATHLLTADVGAVLKAAEDLLGSTSKQPSEASELWRDRLAAADRTARRAADAELAKTHRLSEGAIAREVVSALPPGGLLALGNSLPIRQVDTWCPGPAKDLGVWTQRGTSGIDGIVAGASGAATLAGAPTVLLVGDVSALHDLTGFQAARHVEVPFVIAIVHNGGGRIFDLLPLANHPEAHGGTMDHWTTPHQARFSHAAALQELGHERVRTLRGLRSALERGLRRPGATVVEAVVPANGAVEQLTRLRGRVGKALGG